MKLIRNAKRNLEFYLGNLFVDKEGEDTLWLSVYYSESDRTEIENSLTKIYTLLHSDGDESYLPFLKVDAIDFCTFGNSKPFRVKVRNILNDNYTHFYIKKADASRIYGLELEHILSPNRINFLVYKDTLIEEHIIGIPGDIFINKMLPKCTEPEKAQIAKEFVKFNERCLIGLLGDMRSYNYVIVPIHDFDQVVYRIRAIDFDQLSNRLSLLWPDDGDFAIANQQQSYIFHPDKTLIGQKVEKNISLIQAVEGKAGYRIGLGEVNRYRLQAYTPIADLNWGLVVNVDLLNTLRSANVITFGIFLATIFLGTWTMVLIITFKRKRV